MGNPTQTKDSARVQSKDDSPAQQKNQNIKPLVEAQLASYVQKNILQGGQAQLKPQIIKGVAEKIESFLAPPTETTQPDAAPAAPAPAAPAAETKAPAAPAAAPAADAAAPDAAPAADAAAPDAAPDAAPAADTTTPDAPTTAPAAAASNPETDLLASVPPQVIASAFAEVSAADGPKAASPTPTPGAPEVAAPAATSAPTLAAGPQPEGLKTPTADGAVPAVPASAVNAPAVNAVAPVANAPAPVATATSDISAPAADAVAADPAAPAAPAVDAAAPAADTEVATDGDNPPPPGGDTAAPGGPPPPDGPGPKTDGAAPGGPISTTSFVEETNPQPAVAASQEGFKQQTLAVTGGGVISGKEEPATRSGGLVTNAPNPGNFKEGAKGAAVVEQMAEAKPSLFDKKAFVATLQKKIAEAMPKDEEEASKGPNTAATEAALKTQVAQAKGAVAGDIVSAKDANPEIAAPEKTPHPGALPIPVVTAPAVPKIAQATSAQINDNVCTPYTAEVDNTRVAKPEESSYIENREDPTLENNDEGGVAAERKQAETEINASSGTAQTRQAAGVGTYDQNAMMCVAQIDNTYVAQTNAFVGGQTSKDGADQQQETASQTALRTAMAAIHTKTKTKVETDLKGIDDAVAALFKTEAAAGKAAFKSYVDAKMKAYKEKRYSGWGVFNRLGDAFTGLPDEVNAFYTEGQKIYVDYMTGAIDRIGTMIEGEIKKVADTIQSGRTEIQALVENADNADKEFAAKIGGEYAGKFDELENQVRTHGEEITSTLAAKMEEEVNALKEDIEAMKAANQGILGKIWDAIAGAIEGFIKALKQIADLLKEIASLIPKIMSMGFGKFVSNAFQAIGQGFSQFGSNIGTHLQKGFITWLCGSDLGVQPMEDMSAKSWLKLGLEVVGLTPDQIKARSVELIGAEGTEMMWAAGGMIITFVQTMMTEGFQAALLAVADQAIGALEGFITGLIGDIMKEVMDYMVQTVVLKGIEYIATLLIPGAGFLKAIQSILKFVGYLYENGTKIIAVISNIVKAIGNVVSGDIGGAAALVEGALGSAVPLLIGFLAAILGLDGIPKKVQGIIQKIRKPIYSVIDAVINFLGKPFKAMGKKVANFKEAAKDKVVDGVASVTGDKMATSETGQRMGMETQTQKKDAKLGEEEDALKKQIGDLNNKQDGEVTGNHGQTADKQRAELEAKLQEIQAKKEKLQDKVKSDTVKTDDAKDKLYKQVLKEAADNPTGDKKIGKIFSADLDERNKLLKDAQAHQDKQIKAAQTDLGKQQKDITDTQAKLNDPKTSPEEKTQLQDLLKTQEEAAQKTSTQIADRETDQKTAATSREQTQQAIAEKLQKEKDPSFLSQKILGSQTREDKLKQTFDDPEKGVASAQKELWALEEDASLTPDQKAEKKIAIEKKLNEQRALNDKFQQAKGGLQPKTTTPAADPNAATTQPADPNAATTAPAADPNAKTEEQKLSESANDQSFGASMKDNFSKTSLGKMIGVKSREDQLAEAEQSAALSGDKTKFDKVKTSQEDLKYTQTGAVGHDKAIKDKEKELSALQAHDPKSKEAEIAKMKDDQSRAYHGDLKMSLDDQKKLDESIKQAEKDLVTLKSKGDTKAPGTDKTYTELVAEKQKEIDEAKKIQERKHPNASFTTLDNHDVKTDLNNSGVNTLNTLGNTTNTIFKSAFGVSGDTKTSEELAKAKAAEDKEAKKTSGELLDEYFLAGTVKTVSDAKDAKAEEAAVAQPNQSIQDKVKAVYETVAKGANPTNFNASQRNLAIVTAKADKTDSAVMSKVIIQAFIGHILASAAPGVATDKLTAEQRNKAILTAYQAHADLGAAMAAHIGKAEGETTKQTNNYTNSGVLGGTKSLNPLDGINSAWSTSKEVLNEGGNAISSFGVAGAQGDIQPYAMAGTSHGDVKKPEAQKN